MPMLHIKTVLVMAHLLGLTLGLGGATIIDIVFLRLIVRGIAVKQTHANFVRLVSRVVTWALVLLWLSGIGFEIQYWFVSPELIPNPKVYAKLAIVVILTINGFVLHHRVLPLFYQRVGLPLLEELRSRQEFLMIACGTISLFSWYTPFFLGVAREMNFVVPAWWILGAYASLVLAALGMVLWLGPMVLRFMAYCREFAAAGGVPSPQIPSRDIAAGAVADGASSEHQPSPAFQDERAAEAPRILVRSWPAPAARSLSTFRPKSRAMGSAA